jgi:hypothetical protein
MPILIVTKNMTGHHPRHSNGNEEYSVVQVISIITYYIALVKRQNLPVTAPKNEIRNSTTIEAGGI